MASPRPTPGSTTRSRRGGRATSADRDGLRLLSVSGALPGEKTAVAFVVEGLATELGDERVLLLGFDPGDVEHPSYVPEIRYVGKLLTWPWRGRRFVHWMRWLQVPWLAARIARHAREFRADAILTHVPDPVLGSAARWAARRLGLPFFPFFHNTYAECREGWTRTWSHWVQGCMMRDAPLTFVMSRGMADAMARLYPDVRFEPLVHTFVGDIPDFDPLPTPGDTIRLVYLGNLNHSNQDAMLRLCQVVNDSDDLLLTIHSGSGEALLRRLGVHGDRLRVEPASHAELRDKLRRNDIQLLPHGLNGPLAWIEYETIFPTRTISYLLAGRPILAHVPDDCFLTSWLREHDCAEIVTDDDPAALGDAIRRLAADPERREQLVRNGFEAAEMFRAPAVVDRMCAQIAEALRDRA